jgi:FkbM family methyltransferase
MNANTPKCLISAPRPWLLNSIYRKLLLLTKRHGLISLGKLNAKLFSKGEIVQLPHGASLYCPPDPHYFGYILGMHESHISNLLKQLIQPGDVCFDAGANIGYFSNIMGKLTGPTGQVWAFEPVPENYDVLKLNAVLANHENEVVRPIHAAVSDHAGMVRIVRNQFSTYHQVAAIEGEVPSDAECATSVTLDDEYISHRIWKSMSVLKVDVEGHEWPVIKGCERLIRNRTVHNIIIELTPGPEMKIIQDLFDELDVRYTCWLDNRWQMTKLIDLPFRTDVWAIV